MSRAVPAISFSHSERPTPRPCAKRKVLAIAPPIASRSTLPMMNLRRSSLVETFAPPTSAITGCSGCSSAELSASSSACIPLPAAFGSKWARAEIEACARCAAENPSLT
jgi:hypothetical protein